MPRTIEVPRDDLIRGITEVRAEGDGNTMVGYPIVFDTWTTIDSWEGKFRERIAAGAVNKTIRERRGLVKIQYNHGMSMPIGDLPIARPDVMRTDEVGLWTESPLSQATDVQSLIKPRIAEGIITGMSFRFSVVRETWDKEDTDLPERTIDELRLFEFGPVTWEAYEATQVGIRGQAAFAAWMQQTPEERTDVMRQFGHDLRREIIRVKSGAVVIDTPDEQDVTEQRDEDAPTEGHPSTEDQGAAREGTPEDAPAESHPSTETEDDTPESTRAERLMDRLAATIVAQEANNAKAKQGAKEPSHARD